MRGTWGMRGKSIGIWDSIMKTVSEENVGERGGTEKRDI